MNVCGLMVAKILSVSMLGTLQALEHTVVPTTL